MSNSGKALNYAKLMLVHLIISALIGHREPRRVLHDLVCVCVCVCVCELIFVCSCVSVYVCGLCKVH